MMHLDSLPVLEEILQDESRRHPFLVSEHLHVEVGDMDLSCRSGCSYTQAMGATKVFIQRCAAFGECC